MSDWAAGRRFAHGASNEWAVAGSRTTTGKPILANDPHLDLAAPILWYLARIVTPEGSVKGATVPGAPVVLLGQNDRSPGASPPPTPTRRICSSRPSIPPIRRNI